MQLAGNPWVSFISLVVKAKFKVRLSAHKVVSAKKAIQVSETKGKDLNIFVCFS